jgi:hypothetical protein
MSEDAESVTLVERRVKMKTRNLVSLVALVLVAGLAGPASAGAAPERAKHDRFMDTTRDSDEEIYGHYSHQHGPSSGHLPPTQQDVAVIGKTKLTEKADRISDVAVLGDYAYLGQWAAGLPSPQCRGGVQVVDISNPRDPEKVGFLRSHQDTYATEGVQALHLDTPEFTGDLLVVSNETCGPRGIGGLTLWDVTDPLNPVKLSEDGGDYTDGPFTDPTNIDPVAHDSHSAMAWQDGDEAYVIAIDNDEDPNDLDFFEITDPRNPELIA